MYYIIIGMDDDEILRELVKKGETWSRMTVLRELEISDS